MKTKLSTILGGGFFVIFLFNTYVQAQPVVKEYNPTIGVSDCLETKSEQAAFIFRFDENGGLLIEHQNITCNCAGGDIVHSTLFKESILEIKLLELFGQDSTLADCRCLKNIGYRLDSIFPTTDSITIDIYCNTFEMSEHYQLRIPTKGSGRITLSLSVEPMWVLNSAQWQLSPQPTGETVQAVCTSSSTAWQKGHWYLHDLSGKRLLSGYFTDGQFEVSLSNVPHGVYIIEVQTAQGSGVCRLKCVKGL